MTKTSMTKLRIALALLATSAALAACQPAGDTPAEHSAADRSEGHTASSAGLPPGRPEMGEKLAGTKNADTGQACVGCHGAGGNAPIDPSYPKLGGQYADYLQKALRDYKSGARKNPIMAGFAATLTDKDIDNVAAYFASQPPVLAPRS
jgi:cytochrome c553